MWGVVSNNELSRQITALAQLAVGQRLDIERQLCAIAAAQLVIQRQLGAIIHQGTKIMSTLQDDTDLIAAQTTVVAGLSTFVQGLQAQIAALPGLTAAQQTQIDEIFTNLTANNATIANAMLVNTPAAPPSP